MCSEPDKDTTQLLQENEELRAQVAELRARLQAQQPAAALENLSELPFSTVLLEEISALVIILDKDGQIIYFNPACEALTGYSRQEVCGRYVWDVLLPESEVDDVKKVLGELVQSGQVSTFMNSWLSKQQERFFIKWSNSVIQGQYDTNQYVISTGIEIIEHEQLQQELRQKELYLDQIFDLVPTIISTSDKNGYINLINRAGAEYIGKPIEEIVKKLRWQDLVDDPLLAATIEEEDQLIFESKQDVFIKEVKVALKGSPTRWLQIFKRPLLDQYGEVQEVLYITNDITEIYNTKQALEEQQIFLLQTINTIPNLIMATDKQGKFTLVNQVVANILGMEIEDIVGKVGWRELFSNSDMAAQVEQEDQTIFDTHNEIFIAESKTNYADHITRWMDVWKRPLYSADGEVRQILSVAVDITRRKQAEKATQEQRDFLRTVIDMVPAQISVRDQQGRYLLANQSLADALQLQLHEILGKTDQEVNPRLTNYPQIRDEDILMMKSQQSLIIPEMEVLAVNGKTKWLHISKEPIIDEDGICRRVVVVSIDITNRKKTQRQLEEQRSFLRQVIALDPNLIIIRDKHGVVRFANEAVAAFNNTTVQDIIGKSSWDLHTDKRIADIIVKEDLRVLESMEDLYFPEIRVTTNRGEKRWLRMIKRPIVDMSGEAVMVLTISVDITKHKEDEIAMAKQRAYLRQIIDLAPNLIFARDRQGRYTLANQALAKLLKVPVDEIIGKRDEELGFVKQIAERFRQEDARVMDTRQDMTQPEMLMTSPHGELLWLQLSRSPVIGADSEVDECLAVAVDITRRVHDARLLRQQVENLTALFEASQILLRQVDVRKTGLNICNLIMENFDITAAWIGLFNSAEERILLPISSEPLSEKYLEETQNSLDDSTAPQTAFSTAVQQIKEQIHNVIVLEQYPPAFQQHVSLHAYQSMAVFPLAVGNQVLGAIEIFSKDGIYFSKELQQVLKAFANLAAISLQRAQLHEQVQRHAEALEQRVAKRTAELSMTNQQLQEEIIERKRIEQEVQKERDFANSIVNTAPTIVLVLDVDGKIVFYNPYFEKLSGLPLQEMQGKSWFKNFVPEDIVPNVEKTLKNIIAGNETRGVINAIMLRNGEHRFVEWYDSPLYDNEGQAISVLSVGQDITERLQVEETIKRYNQRLEIMHDIDNAILAAWQPEAIASGVLFYLRKLFDFERMSVSIYDLEIDQGSFLAVDSILETNYPNGFTFSLKKSLIQSEEFKKGEVLILDDYQKHLNQSDILKGLYQEGIRSSLDAPLIANNQLIGALNLYSLKPGIFTEEHIQISLEIASSLAVALQNASLRIELENYSSRLEQRVEKRTQELEVTLKELRRAQDNLIRSERLAAIGELAASVAHELRNPLGAIRTSTYYLKSKIETSQDSKITRNFDRIERQLTGAEKIIRDLLEYARMRPLDIGQVNLNDMVTELLKEIAIPDNVQVHTHLADDMPAISIDHQQIGQVFQNLILNAIQAREEGQIITITSSYDDRYTCLVVEDNGEGISPDIIEKIFEPLFTTKAVGTGLGLAISRRIIEAHQGKIEVRSQPGKGSQFSIWLPRRYLVSKQQTE